MMGRRSLGVLLVSTASWALQIVPHVMTRPGITTLYAGSDESRTGKDSRRGDTTRGSSNGLNEKGLEYELRPSVQETKPSWLVEHYDGKMPALRHRKECYVESEVICQYLDFFFPNPSLTCKNKKLKAAAEAAVDGFFPVVAKYLKHTPDGDADDDVLKANLEVALQQLEDHLGGEFLCGEQFTLMDCSLAPKLYHMKTGVKEFKAGAINIEAQFPNVAKYMETVFARKSFIDSIYPEDVIVWGWGNARQ